MDRAMKTRISIVLLALAIFAIPSFAQSLSQQPQNMRPIEDVDSGGGWYDDTSYSTGSYLDNPCTAVQDLYYVNYSAFVQSAEAEANASRYLFDEDTTMGGTYSASGTSQSDVAYAQYFTLRKYHKVTSTYDAFHVVTVINFNPSTKVTTVSMETACGNGMPDSAQ
jgi:hypothetical protein